MDRDDGSGSGEIGGGRRKHQSKKETRAKMKIVPSDTMLERKKTKESYIFQL